MDEMERVPEMEEAGIKFTATSVEDGKYGSFDIMKREWNGMTKELMDGVRKSLIRHDLSS